VTRPERTYLPIRQLDWRIVIGLVAINTICLTFYRQLNYVANGEHYPPLLTFFEETVGGMAGLSVFPLVYLVAVRFPLSSDHWRRNVAIHLLAVCAVSSLHTSLIVIYRLVVFPLFGFRHVSYGYIPVRYPMEFAHLFIYYWVAVACIYLFHEIRFAREGEIRQAKLEASLAEAQLQNLRLQIEPHFLFNALNAISTAIYENPSAADEMVGRLSELLRQLLKSERSQQVTLRREIELLQLYLRVMETRYEHRLRVSIDIGDATADALVPQLILQPLVENAIRHGMDPVSFKADVSVTARQAADHLVLTVRDHGGGFDFTNPLREGIGLRNTKERLEHLYGSRQSLKLENVSEGSGALVEIHLPLECSPELSILPASAVLQA
jgi:two-component system, LytTR family, sensor kinase